MTHQLSETLRLQIVEGEFAPGDVLPPEEQLARHYRVSRTTVRLAMARLVNEGLIRREQGRGTYVNPPGLAKRTAGGITRDMFDVKSTSNIITSAGMKVGTDVRALRMEEPSSSLAELLELAATERVYYLERLRRADDTPIVLERIWLPERLCPGLSEAEVEGSLYKTLTTRFGHNLAAAHQWLRPTVAGAEIASLLDVEVGAPLMMVRGMTFTSDATPVEVEESYFRGDHVEFVVELGSYSNYARLRPVEIDDFNDVMSS